MIDLELLVYKVRSGFTISEAVEDIIGRNVVELRKAAFGDDMEDSKALPWTRNQAWKIVSELAKKREVSSHAELLRCMTDPFTDILCQPAARLPVQGSRSGLESHGRARLDRGIIRRR